eukprot:2285480-Alexandrium_andersonii.AAC.1
MANACAPRFKRERAKLGTRYRLRPEPGDELSSCATRSTGSGRRAGRRGPEVPGRGASRGLSLIHI